MALSTNYQGGACGAAGPASAPGSAVERPARRTPGGPYALAPPIGLAHSLRRLVLPAVACLALRRPAPGQHVSVALRASRAIGSAESRPVARWQKDLVPAKEGEDHDTPSRTAVSARRSGREGTGDGGGATGDVQLVVDVLQVGAHGSLRYAKAAGDLGVGVPGGRIFKTKPSSTLTRARQPWLERQ